MATANSAGVAAAGTAPDAPPVDEAEEERNRREWLKYYVAIGDIAAAKTLGWDGQPLDDGDDGAVGESATALGADAATARAGGVADEDTAAVLIQAKYKGWSQQQKYRDQRDEAARLQWIDYYVATKQYDAAREYGWDGTPPSEQADRSASVIQRHYRGHRQREDYKDVRDEEARQQWVDYFLRTGQMERAMEYGYRHPQGTLSATKSAVGAGAVSVVALPKSHPTPAAGVSRAGYCFQNVSDFLTPRRVRERRERELVSVLVIQAWSRGMLARGRARLLHRQTLLYELVNRQEERHAKRIEYYINMFLSLREKNMRHRKAQAIQAGYRGKQARDLRRQKAADREAEHRRREAEARAEAEREAQRKMAEEEEAKRAREAAAAAERARVQSEAATPRPVEITDRMSVQEVNTELDRGARVAVDAMQQRERLQELARRTMRATRGWLRKSSPHARLPFNAHSRFFYFETDKLCWRRHEEEEEEGGGKKRWIAVADIEVVEVVEPLEKNEFVLKERSSAKPYRFRAQTKQEMMVWVQALKTIVAIRQAEGRH